MPSSARGWVEWSVTERMPQSGLPLVLLAGDGKEATRWLRVLLEGGGYAVLQERTGQHGLERAGTTEPDVILVDAELPDMAGVELCRMLRADPRVSSSTPILLMIREAATRVQRLAALRAGAWECIAPPHDADEILSRSARTCTPSSTPTGPERKGCSMPQPDSTTGRGSHGARASWDRRHSGNTVPSPALCSHSTSSRPSPVPPRNRAGPASAAMCRRSNRPRGCRT